MLRTTKFALAAAVATISAGGCVDEFRGANLEIDIRPQSPATPTTQPTSDFPVQAHVVGVPGANEVPANTHFTLYAIPDPTNPASAFEIARFELHRLVDLTSPCFIDVGDHVPHPGLHVSRFAEKIAEDTGITDIANPPASATETQKIEAATALQRQNNVAKIAGDLASPFGEMTGIRAITSASTATYPAVATSCNGPANEIPPAMCTDDASNQRRLTLCQAAWSADPNLFEGTDRVLTAPLNGRTYGMVDGNNPVNEAPVGGAQFFVNDPLINIKAYAIYTQTDGATGIGTPLVGSVAVTNPTRGVTHVTLAGAGPVMGGPPIVALMSVFSDLGSDSVHF